MIRNFTLSISFAIAATSFAMADSVTPTIHQNAKLSKITNTAECKSFNPETALKLNAPEKNPTFTDIIYEVPGKRQLCLKTSNGYYPYAGYEYDYAQEDAPSFIVYGDDGNIYIYDVLEYGYPTYTKGRVDGNKLIVDLPQTLFMEHFDWLNYSPTGDIYYNLGVFKEVTVNSKLGFELDESVTQLEYLIGEDGSLTMMLPDTDNYALGIIQYLLEYEEEYDDGTFNTEGETAWYSSWAGYIDYYQKFVPSSLELVNFPEGADVKSYFFLSENFGREIYLAIDDNEMYIQGISSDMPNLTIKGEIKDGKVYFPQNQMVGIYEWENEFMINKCGHLNEFGKIIFDPDDVDYVMAYDAENNLLTPDDPDKILCFAYLVDEFVPPHQDFYDFKIFRQTGFSGTPMNPYGLYWDDYLYNDPLYGYYSFDFCIPAVSTTGSILLSENLYYEIYINGKLQTFEHIEGTNIYNRVEEPMTEIPFNFNNDNDIQSMYFSPVEKEIGIYVDGAETVGVRSVYKYEGVTTYSQQVYIYTDGNGSVESISTAYPVTTEYYDITGRRVSKDAEGILVKRMILSDGTVKTIKLIKKQ